MEIQEAIDIRYEEIEGLQQKLTEDHYMNPEQEDELEELIAQAIKFGELCAKRDAKAQAVPEGFVLVSKTPSLKVLDRLYAEHDIDEERATYIYRDIIDAQEQSHE
ncbi:hypothetical protein [Acinetobacter johnsonii]|uniref:hypothetical protein n=1 Tax=Acinetobacter johnsonii TaxID=40214 RepID=UPI002D7E3307|nr:hypothetical protein [Acinetobacter johnsonii]